MILQYELRDITIVRKYGELPEVPVYVDELNQVWTNLIHNATGALQGRGEIAIETGLSEGGATVRVIDNGPGIPADVIPHIFEPFFTTKPKGEGTGLGLGIVRQIVDKHRGKVSCDSRPGRTCFEIWLPLDSAADSGENTGGPRAEDSTIESTSESSSDADGTRVAEPVAASSQEK